MLCEVLLMQICSTSVFKQTCIPLARIPAGAESNRDICYGKVMNACMCTDNYACVCLLCPRVANQVPRHFAMSNPMVVPGGMEYQTDLYRSIQIYTDLYRTSMTAWGSFCGATSLRDYDWPGWQSETQLHRGGKLRQNVGGICDFLVDTMGIPILVPVVCRPSAICQLDQVVLQWMLIPLLLSSGNGYPE